MAGGRNSGGMRPVFAKLSMSASAVACQASVRFGTGDDGLGRRLGEFGIREGHIAEAIEQGAEVLARRSDRKSRRCFGRARDR